MTSRSRSPAAPAQVEHAFVVSLASVRTASGRIAYRNMQAPSLPADIAPYVQGVVGLDSTSLPSYAGPAKPNPALRLGRARSPRLRPHVATNGGPQPCVFGPAAAGQPRPHRRRGRDRLPVPLALRQRRPGSEPDGRAARGARPPRPTDIGEYQGCYGTSAVVNYVDVDGGPGAYNAQISDGEASLDIEQIIGLAPEGGDPRLPGPNARRRCPVTVDLLNEIVSAGPGEGHLELAGARAKR